MSSLHSSVALIALFVASTSAPALADDILITQAKALAGNVTPGDAPGFPVTLSLPGKYRFATSIYPTANQTGIHVAQRNVTIDLDGFELHGANLASHGITGPHPGATIRNGTITGFKFDGVNGSGDYWTVDNMRVVSNGRSGVGNGNVDHFRVVNSTISGNTGGGVSCDFYCHVEGNSISANGAAGVVLSNGLVIGNTINGNLGVGIFTFAPAGYGDNNIALNAASGDQVSGGIDAGTNACYPTPC